MLKRMVNRLRKMVRGTAFGVSKVLRKLYFVEKRTDRRVNKVGRRSTDGATTN